MTDDRRQADGIDPSRHLKRARAALREAAEHLNDAAAASEHPSMSVASALSHVAAARGAIGLYGFGESQEAPQQDAA